MKKALSPDEWVKEFQDFVSAESTQPPKEVSELILARIHTELNPSAWSVFSKVALIHLVTGTITLLFCPQFGVNLLGGMGLMTLFMRFGDYVCMAGCGAVFLGASALTASLVLRPEEVRVVRKTELLQFSLLGLASIGVFVCAGASVVGSFALAWLAGSVLGGLATLELGWLIRTKLGSRRVYGL